MSTQAVYALIAIGIFLIILFALRTLPTPTDCPTDPISETHEPAAASPPAATSPPAPDLEPHYVFKGLVREQKVCAALEEMYKRGFPTIRPAWLINPATGQPLEYDCYNADVKIAAEHNGEHHYVYPNKYHKTEKEFLAQRARDEQKRKISEEHGVYLLTVPYWVPTDAIKDWVEYYCPERVSQRARVERLVPPTK